MRVPFFMGFVAAATLLAGCGPGSDTAPATAAPAAAVPAETTAPVAATAVIAPQTGIWFEPAGLSACARPNKVMVHWDSTPFAGVKAVDIVAVSQAGKEVLFLAAGRRGSRESGAWMKAGSQMILRNKADGAELGRATVESIPCT